MGVFTDQVQNVATSQKELISEAKRKRLEREEAKRQKQELEEAERLLFYKLDTALKTKWNKFIDCKTTEEAFITLLDDDIKDSIIFEITQKDNIMYYLDRQYIKILNETYKKHKTKNTMQDSQLKNDVKKYELKLYRIFKNTLDRKQFHSKKASLYFKSTEEAYNFLIKSTSKDIILNFTTTDLQIKYNLDKKYFNILNTVYKPFKLENKQTNNINQYKTSSNKIKSIKTENNKNHNIFILILSTIFAVLIEAVKIFCYIFIVPLVFLVSFFIHKK